METGEAEGSHKCILLVHSRSLVSLWKKFMRVLCPGFCGCYAGNAPPPHCLALVASRACVCRSLRTVENKPFRAQHRDSRQKHPSSSLYLKEVYLHTLKVQLPISLLLGTDKSASTLEHWQVLADPQLVADTKNKEGGLDSHKGLRKNQEHSRLNDKIHLLNKTTLSRLEKVAVLHNAQKSTECWEKWVDRGL